MADHDEPTRDGSEAGDAEMRRRLDDVASVVDVGDLEVARADVGHRVGRRRTRRRIGVTIGAVAVIAAATTAVLTVGGDEPDTLVTTDDTQVTVSLPDDDVDSPEPTLAVAPVIPSVEVIDGVAQVGASAGANGAPEYGEWSVPWEDGFLVGSTYFPPQPLPDELPEEVRALFPQEVLDLFDGGLPATISEATTMLSDAGLLDVVSEIISNNPEAYDAIYGTPVQVAPTLDVRFTVDGETWEPREMVLPPDATSFSGATTVGDRLAVVYSVVDPLTGMPSGGRVVVATTTDLSTWTTQEIVLPSPGELPEGVNWSVFAQGLVANESGWVVPVYSSVDIDAYSLVPEDVRSELDQSRGISVGTSSDGVTIQTDVDSDTTDPSASMTYSWEELGVAPDVAALLADQSFTPTMWTASWEGTPATADAPPAQGPIVATPAGFVLWNDQTWFSPDGVTWTASPLPIGASWVSGAFTVDDGLIVQSSSDTGEYLFHQVDERGGDAVRLDLPVGSEGSLVSSASMSGSATAGMIVSAMPPVPEEDLLSVEVDGYRLTVRQPSGVFEVVDVASGDVIVSEIPFGPGTDDGTISFDEAGVTVTDPDTGDVVVVFPQDVLDSAENRYFDDGGGEYNPDFWLVASLDGERFVIDDLDGDGSDGPVSVASNGQRLLVQAGSTWFVYDLT